MSIIAKSLIIWAAIIPLAIANGIFRDAFLAARLGASRSRFVSGLFLSVLILALTVLAIPWLGHGSAHLYMVIGAVWLAATVAFEFIFGRCVAKKSWPELMRAYTFEGGNIWPIVLLVITAAPYLAARIRAII